MSEAPATGMIQAATELRRAPIFCKMSLPEIAQTVPTTKRLSFEQGETIYTAGDPAETLYYVVRGGVDLKSQRRRLDEIFAGGFLGTESVLGVDNYQLDAVAGGPVTLLAIPQAPVERLMKLHPERRNDFYHLLVSQLSSIRGVVAPTTATQLEELVAEQAERRRERQLRSAKLVGWWLAILVPLATRWAALEVWQLEDRQATFLMVLATAVVMWMFTLVPEFIAGIFAVMALLVMGVAPSEVILSGFASGSFFMALSLFALGSILAESGLTYRLVLLISRYLPNSVFWYQLSLLLNGLALTPVLPSANGRLSMLSKVLTDMVDAIGLKKRGPAATFLTTAVFMGASLFAFIFLSSKSANFIVFGLLPTHVQYQFSWGYWLQACLVALGLLLALYMIFTTLYFRHQDTPRVTRQQVMAQMKIIGPLTAPEVVALFSVVLFFLGTLTMSVHKIALPWIGLAVLYLLLALGLMGKKDFQRRIDWSFLVLLGALVGLARAMSYLEIDLWLGANLAWLGDYMRHDFGIFVALVFALILVARLALPNTATVALFATVLLPLAELNGVNPWLVGLLILNFSDAWLMPYQCSYYLLFREILPRGFHDERRFLIANAVSVGFRVLAIYASFPYWRSLGVL